MILTLRCLCIVFVLFAASACSVEKSEKSEIGKNFGAHSVDFFNLSGWDYDNHEDALMAFRKSCSVLAKKSRPATNESRIDIKTSIWGSLCQDAEMASGKIRAKDFFERRFVPYRIVGNNKEEGLFTGYYEPFLYGSLRKTGRFKYPVYAAPPELKNNKPYYTRAEIDKGAIANRGLELLWVDDPVMLFFTHIQGSGRVRLENGKELRMGYADKNGQPYVSLGKIIGDEGYLPKDGIDFFTIREWFYNNPEKAPSLMQRNPSYVFFRVIEKDEVIGAAGVPLTPKRSIAIDNNFIPYGLPLYMETTLPSKNGGQIPFNRLMIAQDTGSAIRSPVRADIFFGAGKDAEYLAGNMKNYGVYTLLVPKEIMAQMP